MRLSRWKQSAAPRRGIRPRRVALVALIGASVGIYVIQLLLEAYQPGFTSEFLALSNRGIAEAYAWQFFTAIFLHINGWHLIADVLVLYLAGRDVESIVGQRHLVWMYFAGAFSGELAHLFAMPADCVLYAASGGAAAVLTAYVAILPELEFNILPRTNFIHLKAKHVAAVAILIACVLMVLVRDGSVAHSAYLGGTVAGWLYAHLLGFGRPSFIQRGVQQRRARAARLDAMSADEFIALEVDPLLEKIARSGVDSLTRAERRLLERARDKMVAGA